MTESLYYTEPDRSEFEAVILDISSGSNGLNLLLDRTCFYPEGGGQPADKGKIDTFAVTDVQKREDSIVHTVATDGSAHPFNTGDKVHGVVDMEWREEYMQQHTGQHILSAALLSEAGCNTVAVHLGEEYVTIEVDRPEVTAEAVSRVEHRALDVIAANRQVRTLTVNDAELSSYDLRRPTKKKGKIRLVIIDEIDCAACGGLHTATTGQVRLLQWIGSEKIRGNARLYWKIGDRAVQDYRIKTALLQALNTRFSSRQDELPERIDKLVAENRELKLALAASRKALALSAAQELYTRSAEDRGGIKLIVEKFEDEDPSYIKELLDTLTQNHRVCCCLFNIKDDHFNWLIGCSEDVELSFNTLRQELLAAIDGKGGGKAPVWQGMGTNLAGADQFVEIIRGTIV